MPPVTAPVAAPKPAAKPAKKPVTKPAPAATKPAAVPPPVTPPVVPPTVSSVVTNGPPPATAPERPREVLYKEVTVDLYCKGSKEGPITEEVAKLALEWEDEDAFKRRMVEESPGTKPETWSYGTDFLLKDEEGKKVRCWNNLDNREFDERHSRGFAQTILNGDWAGPTTMPGETINGSTICISKTGKVESGQHSLIAVVLANQMYRKNPNAYPFWQKIGTEPVIESIIVTGISESPRVIMTVDNCKQRSPSDVFYTSELFRSAPSVDRKEYSRLMATAVDLLWKRTRAQGYKTLPEVVSFQERHKRLLKCVEHLFVENHDKGGRKIAKRIMSAGAASAICYLMACSGPETDGDLYRNGVPPTEKGLDWSRFDKAKEFWALVASDARFEPVRTALNRLDQTSVFGEDVQQGLGGTTAEKLAVIGKAWDVWVAYDPSVGTPPFSMADLEDGGALRLAYNNLGPDGKVLPDGKLAFLDHADFGGIDCPEEEIKVSAGGPTDVTPPVDMEAAKEEERKRRADIATKIKAAGVLGKKK